MVIAETCGPDWIELKESVRLKAPSVAEVFSGMVGENEVVGKRTVPEYDANNQAEKVFGRPVRMLARAVSEHPSSTMSLRSTTNRLLSGLPQRFRALLERSWLRSL